MMSTVTGGPFRAMSAIGSGTSLMPASAPGYMWHWMKDDWMLMLHGNLTVGFNHQGEPRGISKAESQNWLMLMADCWFRVGAMTLGGVRDIIADRALRVGLGADVTFYHVPGGLQSVYGSQPVGFRFFVRLKPGKMAH